MGFLNVLLSFRDLELNRSFLNGALHHGQDSSWLCDTIYLHCTCFMSLVLCPLDASSPVRHNLHKPPKDLKSEDTSAISINLGVNH